MSPSAYQVWRKQADADALNRSQEVRDDVTALSASVVLISLARFIECFYSIFLFLNSSSLFFTLSLL
jgi:hypothetical protein